MSSLHTFGTNGLIAPAPSRSSSRRRTRQSASARSWSANYGSIYDAANRADFSGYIYIPDLKPSASLRAAPLRVIRERTWWLYGNVPPTRMIVDNLPEQECGTGLWPSWISAEPIFNSTITDIWHYQNHDARFFSADGHDDCYSFQINVRRCIRLYGDCFVQLLRPAPGSMRPTVSIIPGYRVDNAGHEKPGDGWVDGCLLDPMGKALFYRVISIGPDGKRTWMDVPADDMIHCHDLLLPGQVRGEPALACVAKRMFRREDILEALANGTLARERLGYAIESAADASDDGLLADAGGEVGQEDVDDDVDEKVTVNSIHGGGAGRPGDVAIPDLGAGKKIVTVESNRPGTNVREFCDEILREVAWAVGYPPDYIFYLAGMTQGTAVRTVIGQVQMKLNSVRQIQIIPLVHRYSVFDVWQRIKAGTFKTLNVPVPDDWWKFDIVPPADISVDPGYVGTLMNERASTGLMAIDEFNQIRGTTTRDVDRANDAVIERRMQWLDKFNTANRAKNKNWVDWTYFDRWPRTSSAPAPVTVADNASAPPK